MSADANQPSRLLFAASVLAALLGAIVPLPGWLAPARPDWLALLVVYWVLRLPHGFGIFSAWLAGLLMDVLSGGVIGRHALALAVVAYAALLLRHRLAHYTLAQQAAVVFLLCAADQILAGWVQSVAGHPTQSLIFLMGSLTAAFCWPLITPASPRDRSLDGWQAVS
ncbi:MAG: Rod shape-determining protein MreD [Pseudomonadales bacterium]|nr:Rod shape-determining protein MreD [Pseudomonadales bacterium]